MASVMAPEPATILIDPLTPTIGAEISGVDLPGLSTLRSLGLLGEQAGGRTRDHLR